jgi:hypothetical protein
MECRRRRIPSAARRNPVRLRLQPPPHPRHERLASLHQKRVPSLEAWDWYDQNNNIVSDQWSWLRWAREGFETRKGMDLDCGKKAAA